jgi:hypothetical protein
MATEQRRPSTVLAGSIDPSPLLSLFLLPENNYCLRSILV